MEYLAQKSRNYMEDDKGKALQMDDSGVAHKFWKMGMVRKNEGGQPGKIVGEYVSARIEVGDGPRQVTVEQLEELLDTEEPMRAPGPDQRGMRQYKGPKVTIELGSADNQWKRKEIEEIIATVKGGEKPKRGRPKKDAGTDNSGNGPSKAGGTSSSGDES